MADNVVHIPAQRRARVMLVVDSRAQAIACAPVVRALREGAARFHPIVVSAGLHRDRFVPTLRDLDMECDIDLSLPGDIDEGQFHLLAGNAVLRFGLVVSRLRPDIVLVQGASATALAVALTAFHNNVPVAHIDAGPHGQQAGTPSPEEGNRRCIAAVASLHFAATKEAREALLHDGVDDARIAVTGATVAESLHRFAEASQAGSPAPEGAMHHDDATISRVHAVQTTGRGTNRHTGGDAGQTMGAAAHAPKVPDIRPVSLRRVPKRARDAADIAATPVPAAPATARAARPLPHGHRVLVSLHGLHASPQALKDICAAVRELALARRDTGFLVPVGSHRPLRDAAIPLLGALPNVHLMPVPPLPEFVACLRAARLVLTDAADVLEQAAALGVPVLALRATPHLPGAVRAGRARLVGTDKAAILRETAALLDDGAHHAAMAAACTAPGDDNASRRITLALDRFMTGLAPLLPPHAEFRA
ncbi:UDP-N-acetylglucosamine 2-epimerase [Nitratidesulfovibrio sp. SRB-5]|uniref:UDP-N-acetylglucosamine 2-epimerase n=1 Tax=Nitratidesulfovibrio sp. SRB-5 TaxID=2872636 RepID=UPI0010287C64|nr:UDP-N-acetylglucosamine 2-epimerase [Nitratidesulfovibrio sp. SRB-5]MBZ2170818.1 UDP-N-acetylglucosamine 2-epimerase [Nitratidesulfovibrio sp. SRB-5]RXF76576.1 UDP-N-acetylglucosamine 2-epimerase [Desulfovibrio sp. DS-1]